MHVYVCVCVYVCVLMCVCVCIHACVCVVCTYYVHAYYNRFGVLLVPQDNPSIPTSENPGYTIAKAFSFINHSVSAMKALNWLITVRMSILFVDTLVTVFKIALSNQDVIRSGY